MRRSRSFSAFKCLESSMASSSDKFFALKQHCCADPYNLHSLRGKPIKKGLRLVSGVQLDKLASLIGDARPGIQLCPTCRKKLASDMLSEDEQDVELEKIQQSTSFFSPQ